MLETGKDIFKGDLFLTDKFDVEVLVAGYEYRADYSQENN